MSSDKKNNKSKAEEPETLYKAIRVFESFEEQEAEEVKWLASQKPEQHLQHAVSLIKRIFAEELEKHSEIGVKLYIK